MSGMYNTNKRVCVVKPLAIGAFAIFLQHLLKMMLNEFADFSSGNISTI